MIPLAPPLQEGMGEASLAPQGAASAPPLQGGWGRPPWRPRAQRQPLLHRRGWVMPPWRPRLEPKKTRTVRVNFRCWPTVGITTIYSFVTPQNHTEQPPKMAETTTVLLPPP
jgi:hypothetical protein